MRLSVSFNSGIPCSLPVSPFTQDFWRESAHEVAKLFVKRHKHHTTPESAKVGIHGLLAAWPGDNAPEADKETVLVLIMGSDAAEQQEYESCKAFLVTVLELMAARSQTR